HNPDDPEACLAVGKFLCFIKNDWSAGLLLLARCNDGALRSVAKTEINLDAPQDKVVLGNSWWTLTTTAQGEDKEVYQRRARYWYLKAIASASEADKASLKQQLGERINSVPTAAGEVHIVSIVGGTESIDIYSDEAEWKSSRRGTAENKINHVSLGDFS